MFWENLKQNPSFSFLSCKYIAYAQNGLCKDKGFFLFLQQYKTKLKLHEWITNCCFSWDTSAVWNCADLFPWCGWNATIVQKIMFASSLSFLCHIAETQAIVYGKSGCSVLNRAFRTDGSRKSDACILYGKLGSMQNFQMGKSSSMCSSERDVNSIPEKVNDALT